MHRFYTLSVLTSRIFSSPKRCCLFLILVAMALLAGCGAVGRTATTSSPTDSTKPGQLQVTPSSINLGMARVGSHKSQPASLANSGPSTITVTQATVTGGFSVAGLSLPITLAARQSHGFNVIFAPKV